jgi:probable rRNA maturation factor
VSGLEVEVIGDALPAERVRRACVLAAATAGVEDGHVAVSFVDPDRIAALNAEHRGKDGPTDVLSFPVDGAGSGVAGARELGDVVICPAHTTDLQEAVVHGMLHLVGMDHETDAGEMLALQAELLLWLR